ncbi:lipoprotein releasing system transmembrane protein [Neisseria meningitidis]|nr:lipoprotein releasing system transmembrane protein [Neisseria meningitidis]
MFSLEAWIGLRYLRAKKRNGFMSFITMVSIAGIALGVTALIVVLSVMNGFQKEIRGQLLNVAPHAEIGYIDNTDTDWRNLLRFTENRKGILAAAPYVSNQALLANAGEIRGVQIRGILPSEERKVVEYGDKMPAGKFEDLIPGEFDIILGVGLAEALGAEVGNKVTVITPEGNVTPAGVVPRLKQFTVVGLVKTGVYEVDNSLAMTHIQDARVLYRLDKEVAGLRLKLADPQNAPALTAKLIPEAQRDTVWVRDWTFSNRSYFEAVELGKTDDVHHPDADYRRGGVQPCLFLGDGGYGKAGGHCDFTDFGSFPWRRDEDFYGAGRVFRLFRHVGGCGLRRAFGLERRQGRGVF